MYSLGEILFMILYFGGIAIATLSIAALIQLLVYQLFGYSIAINLIKGMKKLSDRLDNFLFEKFYI